MTRLEEIKFLREKKLNKLKAAHNSKLEQKGIKFVAIGEYNTERGNPKQTYLCPNGHEFLYDRARVMAGKGKCPSCNSGQRRKNHEGYERELFDKEINWWPLEEYKGANVKIKHECLYGHIVEIHPNAVLRGGGCAVCSGVAKKTPESYQKELNDKGIEYKPLEPINGVNNKINHQCPVCDLIWKAQPAEILKGVGCPDCAKMGFRSTRPATLYYVKMWDKHFTFYKIGVTNKTVQQRLRGCGKQYKILLERKYERGSEALAAEQMILEEYKDARADMPHFMKQGGNSELFKYDILLLDMEKI